MVEPIKKHSEKPKPPPTPTHWLKLVITIDHVDASEALALAKALEENGRELVEGWTKETEERRKNGTTRATMEHTLMASNVFASLFASAPKADTP